MQDWKIFSLGDICNFATDKISVSQLNEKNYISTENLLQNKCGFVPATSLPKVLKTSAFNVGDVLVSNIRPYFKKIFYANFSGGCSNDVLVFRANNFIDSKFLYYVLSEDKFFNYATATAKGTKMPRGDKNFIMKFKINLPPLEVQKKIAAVLSSLDDKIELNNKINKNLEQQAQAIFKNIFVENLSSDWKEIYLSDIADFIGGYSYKGNELKNSDTAMVTIKNFNRNGGFKIEGLKEIQPSAKLKIEHDIKLFDAVVAHTDLTQNAEIVGNAENILSFGGYKKLIFSMDVVKVVPKNDNVSKFLLGEILKTKKFKKHCLEYVNGTTVLHLSKKALPEYKLFFPTDLSVLNKINKIFSAIYEKISMNVEENLNLAEMRDLLLPRLLNGEIDVSKVEG